MNLFEAFWLISSCTRMITYTSVCMNQSYKGRHPSADCLHQPHCLFKRFPFPLCQNVLLSTHSSTRVFVSFSSCVLTDSCLCHICNAFVTLTDCMTLTSVFFSLILIKVLTHVPITSKRSQTNKISKWGGNEGQKVIYGKMECATDKQREKERQGRVQTRISDTENAKLEEQMIKCR